MALQQAGVLLVAARVPQPRVYSRTSCGGNLWKPKFEASSVGECPVPASLLPQASPHSHLPWSVGRCWGRENIWKRD